MRAFTECDEEEDKSISIPNGVKRMQETRNLDKKFHSFKLDFTSIDKENGFENF
jgi:hypothetical protein